MSKTALITGANRGLGEGVAYELAKRGWTVLVCARRELDAQIVVDAIIAQGGKARAIELDVSNAAHIETLSSNLPKVDVLINNAGVAAAWDGLHNAKADDVRTSFNTNALGPFQLIQLFAPQMRERGWGRIVNVSSGMGGLTEMGGGAPAYRISKAALNAVTKFASEDLKDTGILVNSVCPGWVATRMGGQSAPRTIAQGVASILFAVDILDNGPTGGFFRDGHVLAW